MHRRLTLIRLVLSLVLAAWPWAASAQSPISTKNDRATLKFPEQITFSVDLQSNAKIAQIVLEYGVERLTCGKVIAKAMPEFTSSTTVAAKWTWEMKQSPQPPGAKIWWRWNIADADGHTLVTEQRTVTWLDSEHAWTVISGESVVLHWYSGGRFFATDLQDSATRSLVSLVKNAGFRLDEPTDIYVYASAQDMRDAIFYESSWTGGQAYSDYGIVIVGIAPNEPASVEWGKGALAHELTHVLAGRMTFSCLSEVPTWIIEGTATYGEGGPSRTELQRFETAVKDNTLLSVRALSSQFPEDSEKASLAYSQSYSLVNFLVSKHGQDKYQSLLRALRDGAKIDDALRIVYGFDEDGLEDVWRADINAKLRPSAGTTATPTPRSTPVPTLALVPGMTATPTPIPPTATPTTTPTATPTAMPTTTATPTPSPAIALSGIALWVVALVGLVVIGLVVAVVVILARKRR